MIDIVVHGCDRVATASAVVVRLTDAASDALGCDHIGTDVSGMAAVPNWTDD